MYNNNFSGHIPDTLRNCHFLTFLDLGSNQLTGSIQSWIGTEMMILETLILSRNSFDESIPTTLCQLKSLRLLDLSENQLKGEIPRCVFPAMATDESVNEKSYMIFHTIKESLSIYLNRKYPFRVRLKRYDVSIQSSFVIEYLRMIDLSSNSLTQGIPVEITKLVHLHSLNLSGNQLVGSIPSNIGELENLEVLDLSRNQLSCGLPTTMVNMVSLEVLDLSYNTLSGKLLPWEEQFATFGNESYVGNPLLCGYPLAQKCQENRNSSLEDTHCRHKEENGNDSNHEDTRKGLSINPFYITMIAGFFTGFWGSILLFASWRHAYFRFLNNMEDRIYVTVIVTYNKLQRKFRTQLPPQ
ncbi:receptor-like protein EIX2 [Vicia villosa]|uniref:receptor-like protein EIX2 n=1 Tax=Vicia villosa TaxID=3911 RepID=UPI00273AFB88|nr:receptor-like protein EIX2 [Vicia villosa]